MKKSSSYIRAEAIVFFYSHLCDLESYDKSLLEKLVFCLIAIMVILVLVVKIL